MEIVDSATGTTAQVDSNRRLQTRSVTESEISSVSSLASSSFVIYGRRDFAAANTDEHILYVKYTGSKILKIASITFSSNSDLGKAELFFDTVYTSGGTALSTDVFVHNQNRRSAKPLDIIAYHGGTTLVMTNNANKEALDVRMSKKTYTHTFGGIQLGKNDTIGVTGSVGVIGEKIRVMVECFEVDL